MEGETKDRKRREGGREDDSTKCSFCAISAKEIRE